jgi:hypothetical protein
MRRLTETRAPSFFLPPKSQDFVGRAEALDELYAVLVEEQDSAMLHGEPGCGKSTIALKFAWQTQGAFDAVVFQLCGQRRSRRSSSWASRPVRPRSRLLPLKSGLPSAAPCWCLTTSGKTM